MILAAVGAFQIQANNQPNGNATPLSCHWSHEGLAFVLGAHLHTASVINGNELYIVVFSSNDHIKALEKIELAS